MIILGKSVVEAIVRGRVYKLIDVDIELISKIEIGLKLSPQSSVQKLRCDRA